jgi:hypothetical protein
MPTGRLNLVLLRTVLSRDGFRFDESSFPVSEGRTKPWDRLTHLWRSWFPLEDLNLLSAILETDRDDKGASLRARGSFVSAGAQNQPARGA